MNLSRETGSWAIWEKVRLSGFATLLAGLIAVGFCSTSAGEPTPLDDNQLAFISGANGLSIAIHLEMNSAVQVELGEGSNSSPISLDEFGGVMDLASLRFDAGIMPGNDGEYISVGLPGFIGFKRFGFDLNQQSPQEGGTVLRGSDYGQFRLDGSGSMTGSLLLWGN